MSDMLRRVLGPVSRTGTRRRAFKYAIDFALVFVSVLAAYVVRFEQIPEGQYRAQLLLLAPLLPLLRVAVWKAAGVYQHSWRQYGLREAVVLGLSTAAVSAVFVVVRLLKPWLMPEMSVVPLGVIALEGMFTLGALTVARVLARLLDEHTARELIRRRLEHTPRRALLVGAGRAGRMAARELRQRPDAGYSVVGFLDDDPSRHNQVIEGVKVLGSTTDAVEAAAQSDAEVFILTMPSARRAEVRQVVERCRAANLPVRTVPGFYELFSEKVQITKIRPLQIEDLLGREVVGPDEDAWGEVVSAFAGKRILVTGAGGSIGSELCRQLATIGPESLILFENNENNLFEIDHEIRGTLGDKTVAVLGDIRDETDIERAFQTHQPQVVLHAAAFKHVPMMEAHPAAAIDNNVLGTGVVVQAAHRHGVERFLFISTDKAVNPTNVMGASKRMAEMVVLARAADSKTQFACVRFGNVLGSRGSVLHTFRRQIEAGGPVTVTHPEVTRFFMTIPESVRLVLQAAAVSDGGEVYLLDMGEPVKIVDLARQMIDLAGLTEDDVPIEFIGLRPGEKLYEELLRDEEGAQESGVKGVMLAKLGDVDPSAVRQWAARLRKAATDNDADAIRRILAVVAGYKPAADVEVPPIEPVSDPSVQAVG